MMRRKIRWHATLVAFALALALVSAGCAPTNVTGPFGQQTTTTRATATATTLPTATPVPKTLYQANWVNGAGQWSLTQDWKIEKGALVNDGGGQSFITIPYSPSTPDYTVQIVMAVTGFYAPRACGNQYGLEGLTDSGQPEYYGIVICMTQQMHAFAEFYYALDPGNTNAKDFDPGVNLHTYGLVVRGKDVTFLLNGSDLGTFTCDNLTTPSKIMLMDRSMGLRVQSVTVTTP